MHFGRYDVCFGGELLLAVVFAPVEAGVDPSFSTGNAFNLLPLDTP